MSKDGLYQVIDILYPDKTAKQEVYHRVGRTSYFSDIDFFVNNNFSTMPPMTLTFYSEEEESMTRTSQVRKCYKENGLYYFETINSIYVVERVNNNRIYCENCSDVIEKNEYIVYNPTNAKYHNEDCLMDDLKHFLLLKDIPIKFFSQTHCESNQCNQKLKKEALSYTDENNEEYLFCSEACFIHHCFENDIVERIERK